MEPSGTRLAGPAGTNMKTWGYGYPLLCAREVGVFFLPVKAMDTARDDGDFDRKVAPIEHIDAPTALLMNPEPDVPIIARDHPTSSLLRYHSWHSMPVAPRPEHSPADGVIRLGEPALVAGAADLRFMCVECPSRTETSCGWTESMLGLEAHGQCETR